MHELDEWAESQQAGGECPAGCDVRVRLLVAAAAIAAIVLSTRPWLPLAAAACALGVLVVSRRGAAANGTPKGCPARPLNGAANPRPLHAGRLAGPLAAALLVLVLEAFMTAGTPVATLTLGPCRLVASAEGLRHGGLIAARVLGSVGMLLVLCRSASAERIFAALRWARVPRTWIEVAMLMHRYTFTLFEVAGSILAAQKIRLGYARASRLSALAERLRSMGNLVGMVVLRSIEQAERTHEAMLVRGYRGALPLPRLRSLAWRDVGTLAAGLAVVAAALAIAEGLLP
jgi:cobalt/nickel transport system permease protein